MLGVKWFLQNFHCTEYIQQRLKLQKNTSEECKMEKMYEKKFLKCKSEFHRHPIRIICGDYVVGNAKNNSNVLTDRNLFFIYIYTSKLTILVGYAVLVVKKKRESRSGERNGLCIN